MMGAIFQDLRSAVRTVAASPRFTALAAATLCLAIGAGTALFSFIDHVLLRPLPVRLPDELFALTRVDAAGRVSHHFSYPFYEQLGRIEAGRLLNPICRASAPASLTGSETTEQVKIERVSINYFAALGVKAWRGRTFERSDEAPGGEPTAVLRYGFWRKRFGGDPGVIGQSIMLAGKPVTVIGIADPEFSGIKNGFVPHLWVPVSQSPIIFPVQQHWNSPDEHYLEIAGRIPEATHVQAVEAAITVAFRRLQDGARSGRMLPQVRLSPAARGLSGLQEQYVNPLRILSALVGLVLLIAAANVAGLLLARATNRHAEISIRMALGASRVRIVRQMTFESCCVGLVAAGGGILLAMYLTDAFRIFLPQWSGLEVPVDRRVLWFGLALSLLTSLLMGVFPALYASGLDLLTGLRQAAAQTRGGSPGSSGRGVLLAAQVSLSILLLISAGLLARTLAGLYAINPGFDRDNVLQVSVEPTTNGYTEEQAARFYDTLLERIRALPGVESASLSDAGALTGYAGFSPFVIENYQPHSKEEMVLANIAASPGYFRTLGIPLREGRDFIEGETTRVIIVNEELARRFFGGQALGRRIGKARFGADSVIIGVAANTSYETLQERPQPIAYLPRRLENPPFLLLHVRTRIRPEAIEAAIRREARQIDRMVPVLDVHTTGDQIRSLLLRERLATTLSGSLALLALLVVAVGIFATLSYEARLKTREIGIRMALGSRAGTVMALIARRSLAPVLGGAAIGTALAPGAARLLKTQLPGVSTLDPWTFAGAASILMLVAALASYIPARRAARVDPMTALRSE